MFRKSTAPAFIPYQLELYQKRGSSLELTAQTDKTILLTAIDESIFTGATYTIIYDRLYNNPFTNFDVINISPDFFYDSAELMAKSHWQMLPGDGVWCRWNQICASEILVQIYDSALETRL